jgi:Uma2 family endonuclease
MRFCAAKRIRPGPNKSPILKADRPSSSYDRMLMMNNPYADSLEKSPQLDHEVIYPDANGVARFDNTEQFHWIVFLKENLEILLAQNIDVFVAADLLWYPIEGDNRTCIAPDVMVVFGRPKGRRGSYQQWKEYGVVPQIIFEIISLSSSQKKLMAKRDFYETYGVEEYYVYDCDRFRLTGWVRQGNKLIPIANLEGWISPRLGIQFTQRYRELEIYQPDCRRFLNSVQRDSRTQQAKNEAEDERERADRLAAYLRSIGIDPDHLPDPTP